MTEAKRRPYQQYLKGVSCYSTRAPAVTVFYPRVAEPRTGATNLEWVPASGYGTVYAATVMRPMPPQPSYNVTNGGGLSCVHPGMDGLFTMSRS